MRSIMRSKYDQKYTTYYLCTHTPVGICKPEPGCPFAISNVGVNQADMSLIYRFDRKIQHEVQNGHCGKDLSWNEEK